MGSRTKTLGACMSFLRAEIARPRTFDKPWRTMPCAMKSTVNAVAAPMEMPKINSFRRRRSGWYEKSQPEVDVEKRLDDLHYNQTNFLEREYTRTWSNYPDVKIEKKKPLVLPNEEILPIRRRPTSERPSTAQPWDDEVLEFIRKVDSDNEVSRTKRGPNANKYKRQGHIAPSDMYEPDKLYKFYY